MQRRPKVAVEERGARGDFEEAGSARALACLLYDELTDLPTVPLLLRRIRRLLKESHQLGLLSIGVLRKERLDTSLGWQGYESLVRDVASLLREIRGTVLRREDFLSEVMISGNSFVILLSPPRGERPISLTDVRKVRRRVEQSLSRFMRHRMRGENWLRAFFGLIGSNRPRYGGYIVHLAIVLIALGVAGSTFYSSQA
ncbi:MAG: hypothetical protein ACE5JH_12785, partial [Acidobacteriota bacterium]